MNAYGEIIKMNNFWLNRKGEEGAAPFRSGRFYCVGSEWFFAVRRGVDQGPYNTKPDARTALVEYINDQLSFEKHLHKNSGGFTLQGAC